MKMMMMMIIIIAVRMPLPHYAPHAHVPEISTHKQPTVADTQEIKVMKNTH